MRKPHHVTASSIFLITSLFASLAAGMTPAAASDREGRVGGLTVTDLACSGASLDGNVWWNGLHHDTFQRQYRSPFGAVAAGSGNSVRIRFRTCAGDVDSVRLRVWDDRSDTESWLNLHPASFPLGDADGGATLGLFNYWEADLRVPASPTVLYYTFEVRDGKDVDYYVDDNVKLDGGGPGTASETRDDSRSFQLTVYDPGFQVPEWLKGATVYQIFPDRFRNGDPSNDPRHGKGFIYGLAVRFLQWASPICDPLGDVCPGERANIYYGGDLQGVIEKLDYLSGLGVTALYLNPIFRAPSNHRYDIHDHKAVDPLLGSEADFDRLVNEARSRGIRLILDGVFNHVSSDSHYFDYYSRWDAQGRLVSPDSAGTDDGSGACESPRSPYRSWFWIPHRHKAGRWESHGDIHVCPRTYANEPNEWPQTYEGWFGYASLPKLNTWHPEVREHFYGENGKGVGPFWIGRGAAAWRLDVGADVDPGLTVEPSNPFWEEFRSSVRGVSGETAIIGEEWGDATAFLLGNEWDSSMNYRFRSALMSWLADGCRGNGCSGDGLTFSDNDSNEWSHSGAIAPISESHLDRRLKSIAEDYPPQAWQAMLNLAGSHDTNRIRFLLKKVSRDSDEAAYRKHKLFALFQFTYPGAPMVYYGDEAGVAAEGVWDGNIWQDDPYNRVAFPWADRGLSPDGELIGLYRTLGQMRLEHDVFRTGEYRTLAADDESRVFAFARYHASKTDSAAVVILKRAAGQRGTLTVDVGGLLSDGTRLKDQLSHREVTVADGKIRLGRIDPLWGVILVPASR